MMPRGTFRSDLRLGGRALLNGAEALMQRVELVLSTPPGTLPWRPDFGCAIWALMGQPASPQQMARARWVIEEALAAWVPEVEVASCEIALVPGREVSDASWVRAIAGNPLQSGLLHLGLEASLQIELCLKTRSGVIRARMELFDSTKSIGA